MREEKIVDVGPICDGDGVDPMREAVLHNHVVIANNVSQIVVDIILHKIRYGEMPSFDSRDYLFSCLFAISEGCFGARCEESIICMDA